MLIKTLLLRLVRTKLLLLFNITGLSIAFATCIIIMMQVKYELTFDKGYITSGKIYQIDEREEPISKFEPYIARPLAELSFASTPLIKAGAIRESYFSKYDVVPQGEGSLSAISSESYKASALFPVVFGLKLTAGSYDNFHMPQTAIIPESLAKVLFNRNNPIGKTLILNNNYGQTNVEIIAIYEDIPENSSLPNAIITSLGDENLSNWNVQKYCGYVLVNTSPDAKTVEKYIQNVAKDAYSISFSEASMLIKLNELHKRYFNQDNPDDKKGNKNALISLVVIAILIMLVAIINFINFSLSSIPKNIKTINLKKAFGCSLFKLRLEQYVEAIILTFVSTLFSLLLVYILSQTFFVNIINANMALSVNGSLIGIIFIIAFITGIIASLIPAYYSTSVPILTVIQGTFALTFKGQLFRKICIIFQYTTSIALIIISLAVIIQYKYMITFDMGYNKDCILTARFSSGMLKQQESITHDLKQIPSVIDVAYSSNNLIANNPMWGLQYKGKMIVPYFFPVSANFLSLMNITILEGRNFTMEDEASAGKYIFNETAQKEFNIKLSDQIQNHNRNMTAQIIGIAKDFNFKPLHYPIEPFALYTSGESMWKLSYAYIKVLNNNLATTMNQISTLLLNYDSSAKSSFQLEFLDQSIGNLYQKEKNLSFLISSFGILAVIISIIGTIGMIYFETQFRSKEIGIRKVFGATVLNILEIFNKKYIIIILISFIIAAPISYIVILQWQRNFLFKAAFSIWFYLAALVLLMVITTIIVTLQSITTARQNPVKSITK